MPNHVHLLLSLQNDPQGIAPDVRLAVRYYKRRVSQAIGYTVWQKGFYDNIVRSDSEYREIWKYIDENPGKWVLDKYYQEIP